MTRTWMLVDMREESESLSSAEGEALETKPLLAVDDE